MVIVTEIFWFIVKIDHRNLNEPSNQESIAENEHQNFLKRLRPFTGFQQVFNVHLIKNTFILGFFFFIEPCLVVFLWGLTSSLYFGSCRNEFSWE